MPLGPAIAVWAVAGAALGCVTDVQATDALGASVAAFSLALMVESRRQPRVWRGLLLAGIAGVTMAEGALARERALDPPLARVHGDVLWGRAQGTSDPVLVTGTLVADAEQADASVGLLVDAHEIRDAHGSHRVAGRVQLHVAGTLAGPTARTWTAGRTVRVSAALRAPRVSQNPGGPSIRWQTLRRPHVLTGSVKSAALVDVERGAFWNEAAAAVRRRVRDVTARYVAPRDGQSAAVVAAILIGDRAGLAPGVERRLQVAGTYHVIAISGGNVALLTALCFFSLRAVLGSRRLVVALTIMVVVSYGWIVGGDPSVMRAVTAACLVLVVHAAGLVPDPVHLVGAVALILVTAHPLLVVDVGAWLSFGATLGIIVGAGRLVRWAGVGRRLGGRPWVRRVVLTPLATLLAATICAEVTLLPVQANVFSRVGAAGLGLNFIAIPAMACVQVAGLAAVVLACASDTLASAAGWAAHVSAAVLLGSARLVDHLPWLSMPVRRRRSPGPSCTYVCLVAAVATRLSCVGRRLAAAGAALCALAIAAAPTLEWAAPPPGVLRVTLVDVGQGDAILVQFPDRHALLVDTAGSVGSFDVGRRVVTPAAWALGVRRLDWLLVTHPDLDHAGGGVSILEDLDPREVWEGIAVPTNGPRSALVDAARRRTKVWRTVRAGHRLDVGGATLEVLHPPEPDWERRDVRNDDSVVLRLRYGDAEFLLAGDAGVEFESTWTPPPDLGPFRLLKAGHHGSRSSSAERFVDAYDPDVVLVSAGQGNFFGHPHPDVLARFARARAVVFRTDRDGAVIVETDGVSVDVGAMSGRRYGLRRLPEPF